MRCVTIVLLLACAGAASGLKPAAPVQTLTSGCHFTGYWADVAKKCAETKSKSDTCNWVKKHCQDEKGEGEHEATMTEKNRYCHQKGGGRGRKKGTDAKKCAGPDPANAPCKCVMQNLSDKPGSVPMCKPAPAGGAVPAEPVQKQDDAWKGPKDPATSCPRKFRKAVPSDGTVNDCKAKCMADKTCVAIVYYSDVDPKQKNLQCQHATDCSVMHESINPSCRTFIKTSYNPTKATKTPEPESTPAVTPGEDKANDEKQEENASDPDIHEFTKDGCVCATPCNEKNSFGLQPYCFVANHPRCTAKLQWWRFWQRYVGWCVPNPAAREAGKKAGAIKADPADKSAASTSTGGAASAADTCKACLAKKSFYCKDGSGYCAATRAECKNDATMIKKEIGCKTA